MSRLGGAEQLGGDVVDPDAGAGLAARQVLELARRPADGEHLQPTVPLEGREGQLTLPGELLQVGLRLTGPVLLGLALLSVLGRVNGSEGR